MPSRNSSELPRKINSSNIEQGYLYYENYGFAFGLCENEELFLESSKIISLDKILNYDIRLNISIMSALKTLIPSLKFGGDELFFQTIIFVDMPENKYFPITLYYGSSGLTVGGWKDYGKFSEQLSRKINHSIFNLTNDDLQVLIIKLDKSLKEVPLSDFEGQFTHDFGTTVIGYKNGNLIYEEIEPKNVFNKDSEMELDLALAQFLTDLYSEKELNKLRIASKEDRLLIEKKTIEKNLDLIMEWIRKLNSSLAYKVIADEILFHKIKIKKKFIDEILQNTKPKNFPEKDRKKINNFRNFLRSTL